MQKGDGAVVAWMVVALILVVGAFAFGLPKYNIWRKEQAGKAELAQAEWNRQIAVREAEAKRDAAIALANAEIERARGVAEANQIIGESLEGNEAYLRYLWVMGLQDGNGEVVYVATEANLPILEAGRGAPRAPVQTE